MSFSTPALWEVYNREHAMFQVCMHLRPNGSLFPQLRAMVLVSLQDIPIIKTFISPYLQTLRIRLPNNDHNYLCQIYNVAPNVSFIHLSGEVGSAAFQCIPLFKNLDHLIIHFSTPSLLGVDHVRLPDTISSLALSFPPNFSIPRAFLVSSPTLKKLYLRGTMAHILQALQIGKNAPLEEVNLELAHERVPVVPFARCVDVPFARCVDVLAAHRSRSLRVVRLLCNGIATTPNIVSLFDIPTLSLVELRCTIAPSTFIYSVKRHTPSGVIYSLAVIPA